MRRSGAGSIDVRVLVVHSAYQHRGGEDTVVESEVALLRQYGHEVETYFRSNDEIAGMSQLSIARQTLWSDRTSDDVMALCSSFRPEVVHAHNTFPIISPSLYWAADRIKVPVVQTLHNFRLMCLNALYLREGRVCQDCTGKLPWRGVVRGCYRGSKPASAVLCGMLGLHRALGTYQKKVTRYIALNEFCRGKFIEGGLPAERIVIKPNFVAGGAPQDVPRSGLLFVGRLSQEKGLVSLAAAMRKLPSVNLRVAGDGPDESTFSNLDNVLLLGALKKHDVRLEMNRAIALVVPSICFETFGLVVIEAFASSCPVIASRTGALAELVDDGVTGLLFEPGNAADLSEKIDWALRHPAEMAAMGAAARVRFEREFSPAANHQRLLAIYEEARQAVQSHDT